MALASEAAKISASVWDDIVATALREGKKDIDDIAEIYFQKVGLQPSYTVAQTLQESVISRLSLSGKLIEEGKVVASKAVVLGEKVGSAAKTKGVAFVTKHPVISASLVSAGAGGLLVAALQRQGQVTEPADPYSFNTPYDPNNVVINPGTVTGGTTTQTGGADGKKDYGIVGNALAWTGETLFGQTGEEIGNFVDGAKPWVIGGGIVVAVGVLGYTLNAWNKGRLITRAGKSFY